MTKVDFGGRLFGKYGLLEISWALDEEGFRSDFAEFGKQVNAMDLMVAVIRDAKASALCKSEPSTTRVVYSGWEIISPEG